MQQIQNLLGIESDDEGQQRVKQLPPEDLEMNNGVAALIGTNGNARNGARGTSAADDSDSESDSGNARRHRRNHRNVAINYDNPHKKEKRVGYMEQIMSSLRGIESDEDEETKPLVPFAGVTIVNGNSGHTFEENGGKSSKEKTNSMHNNNNGNNNDRTTINEFAAIDQQQQQQRAHQKISEDEPVFFDFDNDEKENRTNNDDDNDNMDVRDSSSSNSNNHHRNSNSNNTQLSSSSSTSSRQESLKQSDFYDVEEEIKKEFPLTQENLILMGIIDTRSPYMGGGAKKSALYRVEHVFIAFANSKTKKKDPTTIHFQERNDLQFWAWMNDIINSFTNYVHCEFIFFIRTLSTGKLRRIVSSIHRGKSLRLVQKRYKTPKSKWLFYQCEFDENQKQYIFDYELKKNGTEFNRIGFYLNFILPDFCNFDYKGEKVFCSEEITSNLKSFLKDKFDPLKPYHTHPEGLLNFLLKNTSFLVKCEEPKVEKDRLNIKYSKS